MSVGDIQKSLGRYVLASKRRAEEEYRLHVIKTEHRGLDYKMTILDGVRPVHDLHGQDYDDTIRRAKAWIDEQDETDPAYDLHV